MIKLLSIIFSISFVMCSSVMAEMAPPEIQQGLTTTAHQPDQCNKRLQASRMKLYSPHYIIPKQLTLLSWNIYKAQKADLIKDLRYLNKHADMVFLQEAIEDPRLNNLKPYSQFSPGYKSGDTQTGVMTLSKWPGTVHCTFIHKEPWLRSPKATNIVEYAMADKRHLLTVNMHGINFTLGLENYKKQLQDVLNIISHHTGPIIFAGDLNTWSDARQKLLSDSLTKLGLVEVTYADDNRTTAFGLPLDHVWTRGITITKSSVKHYQSSDHNPILVTLKINE